MTNQTEKVIPVKLMDVKISVRWEDPLKNSTFVLLFPSGDTFEIPFSLILAINADPARRAKFLGS